MKNGKFNRDEASKRGRKITRTMRGGVRIKKPIGKGREESTTMGEARNKR